jgi:glucokinase
MSVAMPSDVKLINRTRIIDVFRFKGTLSVNDISEETGISRLTIKKTIAELFDRGLIRSAGKGEANEVGGPRPELFEFHCNVQNFCLSIEGDALDAAICDLQNNILGKKHLVFASISLEDFLNLIDSCWAELSAECNVSKNTIYGVILACDGLVDYEHKTLITRAKGVHWGADIPVGAYLQDRFPNAQIVIETTSKMAGVSEIIHMGESAKNRRIIVIYTDTGISSCRIDNCVASDIPHIEVGELGHIMVDQYDREQCGCGSHGCLEVMISERRIIKMAKKRKTGKQASILKGQFKLADVFIAADGGDGLARELVDYIALMFFYAIRNYLTLVRADILIFQGTYARAGTYFFNKLREYLYEKPYQIPQAIPEITCDTRSLTEIQLSGVSSTISNHYFINS